ncbi:hypothetical protein [Anabaena sp. WA102]|uniref:hypothetical protein n=1 Tax=Anabaena sp. WA102 TaxID=1647413 RepID=UPI001900938B|nr:hypothetical protein [Anabaena sp. WA102]
MARIQLDDNNVVLGIVLLMPIPFFSNLALNNYQTRLFHDQKIQSSWLNRPHI